jgi:hypothetical protein
MALDLQVTSNVTFQFQCCFALCRSISHPETCLGLSMKVPFSQVFACINAVCTCVSPGAQRCKALCKGLYGQTGGNRCLSWCVYVSSCSLNCR